jgi:hypothetical protein
VENELQLTHPNTPDYGNRDYWPTPPAVTRELLMFYPPPRDKIILEAAAGDGHIVNVLSEAGYEVHACEVKEAKKESLVKAGASQIRICDFLEVGPANNQCKTIITNPPFSLALEFAETAMRMEPDYLALLLPLTFLASKKRRAFNMAHPPTGLIVFSSRPSFTSDGKGGVRLDLAWFVWQRDKEPMNITIT